LFVPCASNFSSKSACGAYASNFILDATCVVFFSPKKNDRGRYLTKLKLTHMRQKIMTHMNSRIAAISEVSNRV
ncbi:MAG TPA: hypothetical protein PK426_06955, partial [Spirochaetota bacterium]|nr:hypothetical protein [Spirochaetota bacterium]